MQFTIEGLDRTLQRMKHNCRKKLTKDKSEEGSSSSQSLHSSPEVESAQHEVDDDGAEMEYEVIAFAAYDEHWYLACILEVKHDSNEVSLSFLHPHGPAPSFVFPSPQDVLIIDVSDILMSVSPIHIIIAGLLTVIAAFYQIECDTERWKAVEVANILVPPEHLARFLANADVTSKWFHWVSHFKEADTRPLGVGKKYQAFYNIPLIEYLPSVKPSILFSLTYAHKRVVFETKIHNASQENRGWKNFTNLKPGIQKAICSLSCYGRAYFMVPLISATTSLSLISENDVSLLTITATKSSCAPSDRSTLFSHVTIFLEF
ncbi:hypothetical protein Anas_03190 [Armadillidium nasatum]|uniref:Uncharacterized protein n=1 Tax=Armadillidium nasatum TaxID=96803 RepID=A0A5N5TFT8_9CRUS|nr:hypothetical protein Anas_03190 [Armadillidium nasatum]